MNSLKDNIVEFYKVAPYWETLILLWILSSYIFIPVWVLIWIIWWIETTRSFKIKNNLLNILENDWFNLTDFSKYKRHFCDRQAALSALKKNWNNESIEKFEEILENYKKNADDILMWKYIK